MVGWIENNYEKNRETKQMDGRMDKTNIWMVGRVEKNR